MRLTSRVLGRTLPDSVGVDLSCKPGRQLGGSVRHGSSIGGGVEPGRAPQPPGERILELVLQSEQDVPLVHRRVHQICSLLELNTSEQTQIGTAIGELVAAALARAGGAKLEFSLLGGALGTLFIAVHDEEPPSRPLHQGAEAARDARIVRHLVDRQLVDDVDIEVSAAGASTVLLRRDLPTLSPPLLEERITQLREHLRSCVPKTLVEELREQNRDLRRVQQELVSSELSLRRRIRQHALLTEVAEA